MPHKKYWLSLFLVLQVVAVKVLSLFPEAVESIYSRGLYPWLSSFWRVLLGWVPFSVGDVLYGIVILILIRWLWRIRKTWKNAWKTHALTIVNMVSVAYLLFHINWGLNYYRLRLHEKMGFATEYSDADLAAFTERLIKRTNQAHLAVTGDKNVKVSVPYPQDDVFDQATGAYESLSASHPCFSFNHRSTKTSLISLPLTYMGFAGYLNPFTGEAQVNRLVPMYSFPMTTCHEMAHQMGYASESEANFIGFLANVSSSDPYFRYSGYAYALRYCLSSLEKRKEGSSAPYLAKINAGIRANYKESRDFWDGHQTFLNDGFEAFYDTFLKANSQDDGMEGYSKFVDLMVNYYRTKPL